MIDPFVEFALQHHLPRFGQHEDAGAIDDLCPQMWFDSRTTQHDGIRSGRKTDLWSVNWPYRLGRVLAQSAALHL